MNKPVWVDDFNYYYLNFPKKERKVEKILNSELSRNNLNDKDNYYKSEGKSYYGKKRRNYSDYS